MVYFADITINGEILGIEHLIVLLIPLFGRYLFMYAGWRKKLKLLKAKNTVVTQYNAPPDIPPAFFGAIVDNRMSYQDFIATIISMVNRGNLSMSYDSASQEYIIKNEGKPQRGLLEHESYVISIFGKQPTYASSIKNQIDSFMKFNFLLSRDLQNSGYYFFEKNINQMIHTQYYPAAYKRLIMRVVDDPWNIPFFIISVFYPPYAFIWLIIILVYFNRIGLYSMRTKKWEEQWSNLAGYYNYLSVVESDKRSNDLDNHKGDYVVSPHDAYLISAQLQKQWLSVFGNMKEIGAGGSEYNTI